MTESDSEGQASGLSTDDEAAANAKTGGGEAAPDAPIGPVPIATTVIMYSIVVACFAILLVFDVSRETQGTAALVLMVALLLLRVPVGIAMIFAGLLGMLAISGWDFVPNTLRTMPFRTVASWSLSVVPMFILMGLLLWRSGATTRIYDFTRVWFNWMPGGLAITTNVAGAGLAAVSGSTIGIAYALGRLSVPEMLKAGYDPRLATGSVIMAGTLGQLIPPSVLLVLYAGIAGTPIGPQLLSGLIPGLILAAAFSVTIVVIAVFKKGSAPKTPRLDMSFGEKLRVSWRAWPVVLLTVVVVGGIFSGVFTATEAGAYGALGATLITLTNDKPKAAIEKIMRSVVETATATAGIMILIVGATLITRMLTLSGLSFLFTETISNLELSRFWILIVLMLAYLLMGMAIDPLTMMLLTVPLLLPILGPLDVSALWFGVFIVLLGEIAIVTPPVGVLSYVVHKVVAPPEVNQGVPISLTQVFTGAMWFLPAALAVVILVIVAPGLVEWLPGVSAAR